VLRTAYDGTTGMLHCLDDQDGDQHLFTIHNLQIQGPWRMESWSA